MWLIIMLCFSSSAAVIIYTVQKNIKLNQKEVALNSERDHLSGLKSQLQNEREQFITTIRDRANDIYNRRSKELKDKEIELDAKERKLVEFETSLTVKQEQLEIAKTNQSKLIEIEANDIYNRRSIDLKNKEIQLNKKEHKLNKLEISLKEKQKRLINLDDRLKYKEIELNKQATLNYENYKEIVKQQELSIKLITKTLRFSNRVVDNLSKYDTYLADKMDARLKRLVKQKTQITPCYFEYSPKIMINIERHETYEDPRALNNIVDVSYYSDNSMFFHSNKSKYALLQNNNSEQIENKDTDTNNCVIC